MALAITEDSLRRPFQDFALWHHAAPRRLTEKWSTADADARWSAWQKHLAKRKQPRQPRFLAGKSPALLWAWPEMWMVDPGTLKPRLLARGASEATEMFDTEGASLEPAQALHAVALAYALPELASKLDAEPWWDLAESLHALAVDAQQLTAHEHDPAQLVRQQLLAGELPLALSYIFPELQPMRELRESGRSTLSEALTVLTHGQGIPHARQLPAFGTLLACWTRARWLGERLKYGAWANDAEKKYRGLTRFAIRMADGNRRFLFGSQNRAKQLGVKKLLATALELAGDKSNRAIAAAAASNSAPPARLLRGKKKLPKSSMHAELSGLAVLSDGWQKSAARLAVAYAGEPHALELHIAGQQFLAGCIASTSIADGARAVPTGAWEEQLWMSDSDCDYLELGVDLTDGLRLERQFLLSKADHVLFMADTLSARDGRPRQLRHTLGLPLGHEIVWSPERETRDGTLVAEKIKRVAVVPMGLCEWRTDPRGGNLISEGGRLVLTQEGHGTAIYCPLIIDLKTGRAKKERTWRQLTVGEALGIVPRDVAVGYRAQIGGTQWLVYRSLAPCNNRTVLGQNISTEFFAGRFLPTGEIDEWIEIELAT